MHKPVDAVITWVDGQDPAHVAKLTQYLTALAENRPTAAASTRYHQCGELTYCVRSLLKFAPWIRTIYIVTDAQIPPIMDDLKGTAEEGRVRCIDHREIFAGFESSLPTFNSVAIETMLWRIEGLSEQFIYVNDDCMLIRPVNYEDFFRGDALVLRGSWKRQADAKLMASIKRFWATFRGLPILPQVTNDHRMIQEMSARLGGFNTHFFHLPHAPFPLKRSLFSRFFSEHPQFLASNVSYPLRNRKQFWPISLAHHLELQHNPPVLDNSLTAIMINPASHSQTKIKTRLAKATKKNVAFVCLQSMDAAPLSLQNMLFEWLEQRLS